jgi:hypothetical protein
LGIARRSLLGIARRPEPLPARPTARTVVPLDAGRRIPTGAVVLAIAFHRAARPGGRRPVNCALPGLAGRATLGPVRRAALLRERALLLCEWNPLHGARRLPREEARVGAVRTWRARDAPIREPQILIAGSEWHTPLHGADLPNLAAVVIPDAVAEPPGLEIRDPHSVNAVREVRISVDISYISVP